MLPRLDGLSVCKQLKSHPDARVIPIIMVTARGEEADIVAGLEAGADDYVTQPFSPKVLLARVKSVLRRLPDAFAMRTRISLSAFANGIGSVSVCQTAFALARIDCSMYIILVFSWRTFHAWQDCRPLS